MLQPNEETSIRFIGEWEHPIAAKIQDAWFDAIAMNFKIPDSIRTKARKLNAKLGNDEFYDLLINEDERIVFIKDLL
jgi:hypothetical protein